MDKRLQIDFAEGAYQELVELQDLTRARSKSEVIRNALGLLRWLAVQVSAGKRLMTEGPDGKSRDIVFHFLDHLSPVPKKAIENVEETVGATAERD